MLVKCPECELQVSDKAITCPHCGYPLQDRPHPSRKHNTRRRRLPNGFGQISEIKGRNLRKPFRAMVSVGKDTNGRPICKPLRPTAYFETYNEAYTALMEYHKNPFDLAPSITVSELYERWLPAYIKTLKEHQARSIIGAWKYCSSVYQLRVPDLKVRHIRYCMESGSVEYNGSVRTPTPKVKQSIKVLFNLMLDYAVEYELCDKNVARSFNPKSEYKVENSHIAYTDEEMDLLWQQVGKNEIADFVLVQCYSGWRPQELCKLEVANINLEVGSMTGGMKTAAGTGRIVPIHPRILPIVSRMYADAVADNRKYLFRYGYDQVAYRYKLLKKELGLDDRHRPHDGRVQFVTMAKKYNLDEYAIKRIVGHEISDITERVYAKRDFAWLTEEMKKIK